MEFKSKEHFNAFISNLVFLDGGSQGNCYLNPNKKLVYKVFHDYEEDDPEYTVEYTEGELLRFKNVKTKTFIVPEEIIKVNGKVVGHISKYVNAKNLYKIDPLLINLDTFTSAIKDAKEDIKVLSSHGIEAYDMAYNTLYNKKFYIIDEEEYSYSRKDIDTLTKQNLRGFDIGIYLFLIDSYFNEIIENDKELNEMYKSKDINSVMFISELRKHLSELTGQKITYLKDAKDYLDKDNINKKSSYVRELTKVRKR